jgi:hypothetical protein
MGPKTRFDWKFWAIILVYTLVVVAIVCTMRILIGPPRFIRASDGTPCYVYVFDLECNFELANKETKYGEFPYSM